MICVPLKPDFTGALIKEIKVLSSNHIIYKWGKNGFKSILLDSKVTTSHYLLCVIGKGFPSALEGSSCKGSSISITLCPFPPHLFLLPWGDGMTSFQLANLGRIMGVPPPSWHQKEPEGSALMHDFMEWPPAPKSALVSAALTPNPGFTSGQAYSFLH